MPLTFETRRDGLGFQLLLGFSVFENRVQGLATKQIDGDGDYPNGKKRISESDHQQ